MDPVEKNPNNLFDGQPSQNGPGPMFTGLPNDDQFNTPVESPYINQAQYNYLKQSQDSQNYSPEPSNLQVVDPFKPPSYDRPNVQTGAAPLSQEVEQKQQRNQDILNWQAQDSIVGAKDKMWYVYFGVVVAILIALSIFIKSWTFTLLIVVAAITIMVARASSQVKQVTYSVSSQGFYIENKLYDYSAFKSFGVLKETDIYSIVFIPKKRLAASVSIFFPKEYGEKIVDVIGGQLPMEDIKLDIIDKIVRQLRL